MGDHAWAVAGVAIVGEEEPIAIEIEYGDGVVLSRGDAHFVHEGVAHGSDTQGERGGFALNLGRRRIGGDNSLPSAGERFEAVEGFLAGGFGLRLGDGDVGGGEGEEREKREKTKGIHGDVLRY